MRPLSHRIFVFLGLVAIGGGRLHAEPAPAPSSPAAESPAGVQAAPALRNPPPASAAAEASDISGGNAPAAPSFEQEPPAPVAPLSRPLPTDSDLLSVVSDPAAGAFDSTSLGFSRSLSSFGPFSAAFSQTTHSGPYAFIGSLSVSPFAEKESEPSVSAQRGWEAGTRLSGTGNFTLGFPLSGFYLGVQYAGSLQLGGPSAGGNYGGSSSGSFNQALNLLGHYELAKLKLLLAVDYSRLTGPNRDVGQSVNSDLFSASLNASYPLSFKSSLDLTLTESSSQYQGGISSDQLTSALYFNRQTSVKTRLGIGATAGNLQVGQGQDQTFEQLNLRVSYMPGPKFTMAAMVGGELRQIASSTTLEPVFDGSLSYAVRTTTTLTLGASRAVSNSAAASETNYVSSTLSASVSQLVVSKVTAVLSLGYENAVYDSVGASGAGGRKDNLIFVRPSLSYAVNPAFSISLAYSYAENQSTQSGFQTQQVSLTGAYAF